MVLALFLGITASSLHGAVSILLVQQLARQSVSADRLGAASRGDPAADILGARWNTTIWVATALTNAVSIPFYSSQAVHWGRKPLLLLGLGSMALFEAVFAYVASVSSACHVQAIAVVDGCRPDLLFGILATSALLSGILGGDQLVVLAARMVVIDESTEDNRAERINYLQAIALAGYALGPLLASLLAGQSGARDSYAPLSPLLFFTSMAIYLVSVSYVLLAFEDRHNPAPGSPHTSVQHGEMESPRAVRSALDHCRAIVLFQPGREGTSRALPPLRRLPVLKILLCAVFSTDGASIFSYMLLFGDTRFDWTAREVGQRGRLCS